MTQNKAHCHQMADSIPLSNGTTFKYAHAYLKFTNKHSLKSLPNIEVTL